ncbi:hypothetical protein JNM05_05375 [bacterium]|nr:hypothetical protein [bacterium]
MSKNYLDRSCPLPIRFAIAPNSHRSAPDVSSDATLYPNNSLHNIPGRHFDAIVNHPPFAVNSRLDPNQIARIYIRNINDDLCHKDSTGEIRNCL